MKYLSALALAFAALLEKTAADYVLAPDHLVQVAIGYDGMADQGPLAIGLEAVAKEARVHGG